jgi:hypothetical protein
MAKDSYRMMVEVDVVDMSGLPALDQQNLRACIQERYDNGWTYRGLSGTQGTWMFLAFVKKMPRD